LINRLQTEIQERLDQLLDQADRLRRALVALDPREKHTPSRATPIKAAPRAAGRPRSASSSRPARPPTGASKRTASGATKGAVLQALADGTAMTAGEVAAATGLARGTVSTTLSKLAKSGELLKAERGYQLPAGSQSRSQPNGSGDA